MVLTSDTSQVLCVEVTVDEDGLVEADELFQVQLLSTDPIVEISGPSTSSVIIINTDGKVVAMCIIIILGIHPPSNLSMGNILSLKLLLIFTSSEPSLDIRHKNMNSYIF